eukprot:5904416-Pleurochrysis_carterae.AAC.3
MQYTYSSAQQRARVVLPDCNNKCLKSTAHLRSTVEARRGVDYTEAASTVMGTATGNAKGNG